MKQCVDFLADARCRSKSLSDAEAIRDFADLNAWQNREIRIAVAEAESGDFASDDCVRDVLHKWGVDIGHAARDEARESEGPHRAGDRWP